MNSSTRKKKNIILVDDNFTFRNVLKNFLQNELSYHVIADVSSGNEFFALETITSADIILMDLHMPEMDGYEVTKKFLSMYIHIPVIAITMFTDKAYIRELIQVGFKGCVFKPEIYNNIQKTIENIFNNKYSFPEDISL